MTIINQCDIILVVVVPYVVVLLPIVEVLEYCNFFPASANALEKIARVRFPSGLGKFIPCCTKLLLLSHSVPRQ